MSLFDVIAKGGVASLIWLLPLGACSLLVVAVTLERIWAFSRLGKIPGEMLRRVQERLGRGDWQAASDLLTTSPTPYARIAMAATARPRASKDEIMDALTLACDAEIAEASRPLPIVGTIGNIAPFIGLFGTVIGIMRAFHEYGQGALGVGKISAGIAEALIATAIGLGIGITAVIVNNWFNAWVERYRLRLERFATEWAYTVLDHQDAAVAEKVTR